jgi:hypothetical protein
MFDALEGKDGERRSAPQPHLVVKGSRQFALLARPLRLYQHIVVVIQQVRISSRHVCGTSGV